MGMFKLLILGSGKKEVYSGYSFVSEEHVLHSLPILYLLSLRFFTTRLAILYRAIRHIIPQLRLALHSF